MGLVTRAGVVEAHRVGFVQHEPRLVGELGPQHRAQIAVALDRPDLGAARQQSRRERADARADLDHAHAGRRAARRGDGLVHVGRVEEVLPPALARPQTMTAQYGAR
jgi:hypothetical protein